MNVISNSAARRDIESLVHPYTNLRKHEQVGPTIITKGKGVRVFDDRGKGYIEGLAGLWCVSLGWGEEELIAAATEAMRNVGFYHTFAHKSAMPTIDLADRLKQIAPFAVDKVFFANSGSEANDSQVKLVWYINNALGRPRKKKIISRIKAYHGVTIASASLTGLPNNHRDFDLPIAGILHADCPHHYRFAEAGESEEAFATRLAGNLEKLILKEDPETVAAFIAEPIMGAGGVIVPPATYFQKIQAVLRKYDVLMIVDEVITGFARTGNMWGSTTFGIEPDSMSLAKAVTSAYLPLSAVLMGEKMVKPLYDNSAKIGVFGHGFTYSGHPVPAAVGLKTIELMERRDIVGHVRKVMPLFQKRLRALADHPLVGEVRGVGLIGAIELVADKKTKRSFEIKNAVAAHCAGRCEHHGLIVRPLLDTIALCPPLIITEAEIDEVFAMLSKALDDTLDHVSRNDLAKVG
ncbi:MAG: aspartate aminotransferase family protein [Alphaproteobacteria bacterium]|nr:aspartate aminotransferase family protein [Alphaproteobacteria bacterium]